MFAPTGPIKTKIPNVSATIQWEAITQHDEFIIREATPLGWPVERIRGHIAIESQGDPLAKQRNLKNGDSYGLMQVVPYGVGWEGWHKVVKEKAGLPANASQDKVIKALKDPAINIACGIAVLESFYQQYGTTDKASSAFFTGRSDWGAGDTVNGTTGKQYQTALNGLIAEQKVQAAANDPISIIVGGVAYPPIDYGFGSDAGLNYYKYGVGHGTQRPTQHTGYDVSVPCGTKLYTPISGVVDCVGSRGTPRWGQGCGAYADVDGGGIGNITIYGDSGHKLTLGHCRLAYVRPGDRVEAGQLVGTVGSMNGCHVHVEVSVQRNGTYWLLDPGPALIEAMGGTVPAPPVTYPEPNTVPQPGEFDVSVEVTVTADTLPVLQRADLNAAQTKPPLKKGDTFNAVYQALGNDLRIYWITTLGNRVPVEGTSAPDWKGGSVVSDGGISQESLDVLVDTLDQITVKHDKDAQDMSKALRATITALGNLKGEM